MTDRQTQTAELLKLLGEDTAQAVLSHLRPDLAKSIRTQMESPEAKQLKLRQKRELLKDFEWFFDFALQAKPAAGLKVFSGEDEEADRQAESKKSEGEIRLTGDPMVDLGRLSIFQLAGALESEQPRTVAILLNNVPPELAANVLSYFPEEHRQLVAKQLSKEQDAPQVLVERIARATVQRGATLPADPPDRRDHLDRLGEVMREVPKSYRKDMMAAIEEEDAELSAALLKKLYRFDDIAGLEPHIVQQILGEVDGTTLTTAMFQADQNVLDTILGNLSRRARATIEEELQFQTRVPEAQVTAAREAVAEIIAKIDQEGE